MSTAIELTGAQYISEPSTLAGATRHVSRTASYSSTLLHQKAENGWARPLMSEVVDRALGDPKISPIAARKCVAWIRRIPVGVPVPFFAVGEDGSLGLEWDKNGSTLFLLFNQGEAEAYFEGANGDEWESDPDVAIDKLLQALRVISGM
ncbi:hypothetical protein [Streptomyces sp. NBC_00038]|uniref:hypothetical protein n=1 Tax=Streptomyces sp. NBC_00038 TaxID=2903615 RepID=UPI00224EDB38|nr:hypothetical protein [Streptomyces sp. NBC_00038]MCX5560746.1 hypothetical protein [Streptomyces sp. NBC_00038]